MKRDDLGCGCFDATETTILSFVTPTAYFVGHNLPIEV